MCDAWDGPAAFHTRADERRAASIRLELYASRQLPPATGCLLAGSPASFAQAPASAPALGFFLMESEDTEGGAE